MLKNYPLTWRFILFMLIPLIALGMYWYSQLQGSLPGQFDGLRVKALTGEVVITRDDYGVPTITASTDDDVFFGLGYAHAQDRLWQIEVQRRLASGTLSEVFGRTALNQDIWLRTLGLYESAEKAWHSLSDPAKASLEAYSAGMNQWLKEDLPLPIEFRLLDIEPQPWRPVDTLAWIKVFALDLGGNFTQELRRLSASRILSDQQLDFLFPGYDEQAPVTVPETFDAQSFNSLLGVQQELQDKWQLGGRFVGSNAWVVSGQHTDSGLPMLANDPHLGLQIPSLWYMARLQGGALKAEGMSLVGLPLVIFGRNERIAWGGTNLMADVQDLYFERTPAVEEEGGLSSQSVSVRTRRELFVVKPEFPSSFRPELKPVSLDVRETRHGPLITDVFKFSETSISLQWTGLSPDDTSYEAMFRLNYAHDWDSFREALGFLVAPALNMVYADADGNIGYQAAGRIPIRKTGQGILPLAGWDESVEWSGFIPADELPSSFNPEQGYLVSANNKPVDSSYPHFLSHDWAPPGRAERIEALLQEQISNDQAISVASTQEMQLDAVSRSSAKLSRVILSMFTPVDDHEFRVVKQLKDWDGQMNGDSVATSIFIIWTDVLRQQIFADELSGDWSKVGESQMLGQIVSSITYEQLHEALSDPEQRWCDDVGTPDVRETCAEIIEASLMPGLWEVFKFRGDRTMASWRWETIQKAKYSHQPFSNVSALAPLFERQAPSYGSPDTVSVAAGSFKGSDGYVQTFGAGFRQIISWQPDGASYLYVNSTGQSGNVMSPNYDDMVDLMSRGELVERPTWGKPVEAAQDRAISSAEQAQGVASDESSP